MPWGGCTWLHRVQWFHITPHMAHHMAASGKLGVKTGPTAQAGSAHAVPLHKTGNCMRLTQAGGLAGTKHSLRLLLLLLLHMLLLLLELLLALLHLPLLHFVHISIDTARQLLQAARPVECCFNVLCICSTCALAICSSPAEFTAACNSCDSRRDLQGLPAASI